MPAAAAPAADLPVAIVGAGFSGTLLAVNLLRMGARVVLIERDNAHLARGLAYGTRRPEHLLNVRASNMSAFPDDPGHFLRWMGFASSAQHNRFVPRLAYGRYVRELLFAALAATPGRIAVKQQEAVDIAFDGAAPTLVLDSGERVAARAVVLALGNPPPTPFAPFAALAEPLHFVDPWRPGATQGLGSAGHVLLLGTGLTAVDMAVSLDNAGFRGTITALSRRGLAHRAHTLAGPEVPAVPRPLARGSWLLHQLRRRAREVDWRQAVDELRPHTQDLWRLHDHAAQARFLRHARPWWDVHRHRLAPPVAERIAAMQREGRLAFVAGKIASAEAQDDPTQAGRALVRWRPRGAPGLIAGTFDRIITCTGPAGDIARSPLPLVQSLRAARRIRADAHGLGIAVDRAARVCNAAGVPNECLFAVGPPTRGEAWEIIAVPDIRRQVWDLARRLTQAQWVGGEL